MMRNLWDCLVGAFVYLSAAAVLVGFAKLVQWMIWGPP